MKLFRRSYIVPFALACTVAAPLLHADEWDRRTIVTFNQPVEIPRVVLSPGTYVVKLVNSLSDRDIVQFLNQRENHVFATVLAIPDYEPNMVRDHSVFTFEERAANAPQALKTWFYPGDNWGEEFVYPKAETVRTAPAPTTLTPRPAPPEPSHAAAPPAPASAPVIAQNTPAAVPAPQPPPVEIAQAQPVPAPVTELPKTASTLPLIALLGAVSVASGAALRSFGKTL
jgi:hypothetical protein